MDGRVADNRLGGTAVKAAAIRFSGLILAMAVNILLVRLLGAAAFGTVTFFFAVVAVISSVISGGLPHLLAKEVAKCPVTELRLMSVIPAMRPAAEWVIYSTLFFSLLFFFYDNVVLRDNPLQDPDNQSIQLAATIGLTTLGVGMLTMLSGIWRGCGYPLTGDIPVGIGLPAIFLGVSATALGSDLFSRTPMIVMWLYSASAFLTATVAVGFFLFRHQISLTDRPLWTKRSSLSKAWLTEMAPFAGIAVVASLNLQIGTLIIGLTMDEAKTAEYRLIDRLSSVISVPLVAVNAVIAGSLAKIWAEGRLRDLSIFFSKSRDIALVLAIPIAVVLFAGGADVFNILFGFEPSSDAQLALGVMCIAQLVNVGCGPIGLMFSMIGMEKVVLREQFYSALLSLALLPIAASIWGIIGGASISAIALVLWNLRLARLMRNHLCELGSQSQVGKR